MTNPKIVQINNQFIQDENLKKRYEMAETKKQNRFLGLTMVLIVLLFILPTYNMMTNFVSLSAKKEDIKTLKTKYAEIGQEITRQQELAKRLKNDEYVEKYARAKYYYSLEGEVVYLLPDLLPK